MEFKNLSELKDRVMPALMMREDFFKKCGYNISADDIWIFLKHNKWINSKGLTLNEIVNDILKVEADDVYKG